MTTITLKYRGKKGPFTLNLPYLQQKYVVTGPDALIQFLKEDAAVIIEEAPKMFSVVAAKIPERKAEKKIIKDPDNVVIDPETINDEDIILNADEVNEEPGELLGDGAEGDEETPGGVIEEIDVDVKAPIDMTDHRILQKMSVVELMQYANETLGLELEAGLHRQKVIKAIKEASKGV